MPNIGAASLCTQAIRCNNLLAWFTTVRLSTPMCMACGASVARISASSSGLVEDVDGPCKGA
eukprot:8168549-Karenia_brevis.AAC.1